MHDLRRITRRRLVEHANYAYMIAWPAKMSEQGGAEGRQPALGGRVRAK